MNLREFNFQIQVRRRNLIRAVDASLKFPVFFSHVCTAHTICGPIITSQVLQNRTI